MPSTGLLCSISAVSRLATCASRKEGFAFSDAVWRAGAMAQGFESMMHVKK